MARTKKAKLPEDNTGSLPLASVPTSPVASDQRTDILSTLSGYKAEAIAARDTGLNPRGPKWSQNSDLYWGRYDFSGKAPWQAKEVMPEVSMYVDRFAAALKTALNTAPFYTVRDPLDTEKDLTAPIKQLEDAWLSTCGRSAQGVPLDFSTTFEEVAKLGAIKAMCSVVTWKKDVPGGRVACDPVDPHFFWMDHTGRNLYRFRRTELDKIDLIKMLDMKSTGGDPLFDMEQLRLAIQSTGGRGDEAGTKDQQIKQENTGGGTNTQTSRRNPYMLEEWIATVVDSTGNLVEEEHSLYNVINDQFLVRGPEQNPYWHGNDWVTYAPTVIAPLSVYGRSYMEDFGSIAKTYNDMTNLLLDAVHTSSLNAFAVVVEALDNPEVLAGGIVPNLLLKVDAGFDPNKVFASLELGKLDQGGVQVWQALLQKLQTASGINEQGLGQLPSKTHISATASDSADANQSAMLRGTAQTMETRWIDPTLDNIWKTGMQFTNFKDPRIVAAIGPEFASMFNARKKEFITRPMTFQARGISEMIAKKQAFQQIIALMQVIGQNQNLAQLFIQSTDLKAFMGQLFYLSGIDPKTIGMSARAQAIQSVVDPMTAIANGQTQAAAAPAGAPGQPNFKTNASVNINQLASQLG